jgi:serine-type D-Ala-D-Ala carboxypeptidase (penicillin-binding protein 5/6)
MGRQRRYKKRTSLRLTTCFLLFGMGVLVFNYLRPLPEVKAALVSVNSEITSAKLVWPSRGDAAIGAQNFGVLATRGPQTARPIASLAKLITALAVLEKHPLKPGQQGPVITLGAADVALFEKYYALNGSVVKVQDGERITLYQALQALLLPSANNMADSLAIWSFGSIDNYIAYANTLTKRLGLSKTTVAGDASGMSPATVSTTADLIRLGELSLHNPVIAEIVSQRSATIPVHGAISSANSRLGFNNVIGIKTGLTDEAGGCFMFAANHRVDGQRVTIIGVIIGAPNLRAALSESEPLLNSAKPYFTVKTPIKAGQSFAKLTTPWLATADAIARQDVKLLTWQGAALTPRIEIAAMSDSLPAGTRIGTALISSGNNTASTPLVLREGVNGPSWQWRLKRF